MVDKLEKYEEKLLDKAREPLDQLFGHHLSKLEESDDQTESAVEDAAEVPVETASSESEPEAAASESEEAAPEPETTSAEPRMTVASMIEDARNRVQSLIEELTVKAFSMNLSSFLDS